ncbi:hypothetical protein [Neorhizobium sp. JUb45]|uniref:hypothetical protein n=1 Tax=Neorhizobium sp. JUb45 TaxID=2485113 RepID=UPI001FDFADF3|nr:hypothetical protein [Neorhizobium sp. JUb45]
MMMTDEMKSPLSFTRPYLAFSSMMEPYQRADDVGYVVTEFMSFKGRPYYPIGALTSARVTPVHLTARNPDEADEDNLDLIFRMREAEGGYFFEIVLRCSQGTRYGGWIWGYEIEILDEVVEGYHVLSTHDGKNSWRFTYCSQAECYRSQGSLPVEKNVLDRRIIGPGS